MKSQDDASGPIRDTHEQASEFVRKRLRIGRATPLTSKSDAQLRVALDSIDWSVRVAAVQELGARGGTATLEWLVGALQDEHEAVRANAARSLGKLHIANAVEPLLVALHDPAWLVRASAAQALSKAGPHLPVEPLLLALRDEDDSVRAAAVGALGALAARSPLEPLLYALHDPAWHVREMAVLALGSRIPAEALLIALHDEDASVRKAALSLQLAHPQLSGSSRSLAPAQPRLATPRHVNTHNVSSLTIIAQAVQEPQDEAELVEQRVRYPRQGRLLALRTLLLWGWCPLIAYLGYCTWALYQGIEPGLALTTLCLLLLCGYLWATGDSIYEHRKMRARKYIDESEEEESPHTTRSFDDTYDERYTRGTSRRAALVGLAAAVVAINGIAWFSLARSRQMTTTKTASVPGRLLAVLNNGDSPVLALAWSPDARRIVLVGLGVRLWTVATNQYTPIDLGNFNIILAVAWSANGKYIVSGGRSNIIYVWDATTGKIVSTYNGHNDSIHSLAWAPDGKHIISSSADSTVSMWEAMTSKTTHQYQGKTSSSPSVAWSPDGAHFAVAGQDNLVWVRDFATNEVIYSNSAIYYNDACSCKLYSRGLAWSPDSSLLAYGTPDGVVHVVNVMQRLTVLSYGKHRAAINDLCWSPDGLYIASASDDHTVQLWEATTGKTTLTYKGHNGGVTSVRWSPDGARIVSANPLEYTAQVWLAP